MTSNSLRNFLLALGIIIVDWSTPLITICINVANGSFALPMPMTFYIIIGLLGEDLILWLWFSGYLCINCSSWSINRYNSCNDYAYLDNVRKVIHTSYSICIHFGIYLIRITRESIQRKIITIVEDSELFTFYLSKLYDHGVLKAALAGDNYPLE